MLYNCGMMTRISEIQYRNQPLVCRTSRMATELLLLYPHFYRAGYTGMGLYLEMGYLLFCAYYDKTLTPAERVMYASASKAIMVKWREKILVNLYIMWYLLNAYPVLVIDLI